MSQTTISSLPSPSRSQNRTLATTGTGEAPAGLYSRRENVRRSVSFLGQGSGRARLSVARDSK